ncbi:uncharacterized protein Z518_05568 [Rhinocladiella mackenziei CBS 650.93]|uniref:Xaa-Pro dipeptidyl-peptidase C-terminal domain-containing protein n=1 Tax=Rhinocladiella mackenziei CBS 650.93 TaxID=1442369 RepID=A0A0D2H2N9_9EURO|nr:uncharacterized protein Z518_05568 [Rhinocladiella mackenziei CBS 650.93]KIX04698.1 hypothetical protein Z518_05568 [Rhinocladiella mackenziei CBS 650.93]
MDSSSNANPYGWSDVSYYLPMRDGVRLAVSVYFPERTIPTSQVPTLLVQTRYGRATARRQGDPRSIDPWLRAGYASVVVDVRGTTASFGPRAAELGPDEQQDAEEIIAHITAQPWSNGKVISTGVSYTGNTADMATARDAPGLIASIPRATDFDFWELFWPGGCPNDSLFKDWSTGVYEIDFGRPHTINGRPIYPRHAGLDGRVNAQDCLSLFPTFQPVDEDPHCLILQQALRTREGLGRHWRFEDYDNALFRDDAGLNGHKIFDSCTAAHIPAVLKQKKPVQFWASWVDANTADEAINRFRCTPGVPTEVFITAHDHSGGVRADPLLPGRNDPMPSIEEQHVEQLRFAAEAMQMDIPERYFARIIHYYVLGTGRYLDTLQWPPIGIENTKFLLGQEGSLGRTTAQAGIDTLRVDYQASTGKRNRWYQFSTPDYADRSFQDTKILTYDTSPLERDTELCGWPVVNLHMRTQTDDPTIFAYLEDVAPDGRVTYLTEGMLRAIHRKVSDTQKLPYDPGPSPHSFARADAEPVVPEQDFTVAFKLFAIAALIKKDHRIRLAIAGADADTFRPIHRELDERFDIHYGGPNPSTFEVPLRAWQF